MSEFSKERIVLPEWIYILAGNGEQIEQFNLYYRNAVMDLAPDEYVRILCGYGRQYQEFWRIEPGNAQIAHYDITSGEFPFTLQILDRNFALVSEKTIQIVIIPKETKPDVTVLCIGDSITHNGNYVKHAQSVLPYMRSVGIRTGIRAYDNGEVSREGRGGWTAEMYVNRVAQQEGGDSPFLFPAGKPGASYWGNTSFWEKVVGSDPQGYAYEGFQMAGRVDGDADGSFLFAAKDGYPLAPKPGDVICDPQLGETPLCEWNGAEWQVMHPQPEWELDFGKYLERFKTMVDKPDVVTLLFGANEFQTVASIVDGIDIYLDSMQRLIDAVQRVDASIQIIVNLPFTGAGQDAWGLSIGCNGHEALYRRNIQEACLRILQRWDHAEAKARGIWICPMLLVVDPQYGFGVIREPVSKYVAELVDRHNNWVHPNLSGHYQMGDALAAVLQIAQKTHSPDSK